MSQATEGQLESQKKIALYKALCHAWPVNQSIRLMNATKRFSDRVIFSNLNIDFEIGKIHALIGRSGCGKSTLLRILAGLEPLTEGHVEGVNKSELAFVFQEPRLLPWLTVKENVHLPARLRGQNTSTASWLKSVHLDSNGHQFPHELSGGMKMRVSLARALINNPKVLFFDEPFSALDEWRRQELQDLVLEIHRENLGTYFFVTHSISEACYMADHIFLFSDQKTGLQRALSTNWNREESQLRRSPDFLKAVANLTIEVQTK